MKSTIKLNLGVETFGKSQKKPILEEFGAFPQNDNFLGKIGYISSWALRLYNFNLNFKKKKKW